MSLTSILTGLHDANIRFVVIGGVAAVANGSPRLTNDVDICFDRAPDNVEALARLLASWDAYPREVEPGLPFLMDARTLRNGSVFTLRTREGFLDIFDSVDGVGDYGACLAASEWIEWPPIRVRMLNIDALISSKQVTGRKKDAEHVLELRMIRELRKEE
jgi:predicted nucleotidyltransferase